MVRGYTVRKMPLGAFLRASSALSSLPEQLLQTAFPGQTAEEILRSMETLTPQTLLRALQNALQSAPGQVVRVFCELSGLSDEELLNDPALGPDGLLLLMEAWAEVNGLQNFIAAAKRLRGMALAAKNGCSA